MYSSSYLRIRAADTEKSVSDFNMFSKHIYILKCLPTMLRHDGRGQEIENHVQGYA